MAKTSKASQILKGITQLQLTITLYSFLLAIRLVEEAIGVGHREIIRATRCRGLQGRWQRAMSTLTGRGLQEEKRIRLAGMGSRCIRGQNLEVKDSPAIHSRWPTNKKRKEVGDPRQGSHHLEVRHRCSLIRTRAITQSSMATFLNKNSNNNSNITIHPKVIKCSYRQST